jgi:hypothetical protein
LNDPYRYQVELMTNGLIRVFDLASKLKACYNADGTYRHGDLRRPTLAELLDDEPATIEEEPACAEFD